MGNCESLEVVNHHAVSGRNVTMTVKKSLLTLKKNSPKVVLFCNKGDILKFYFGRNEQKKYVTTGESSFNSF